ncbi:MAG: YlxM family DNA-binding protein [Candidatus Sumerlaeia bacterium]|nr:YlxM family DNA-binding protein [Candidatus Sumerlaeia bacterium]
MATDSVSNQVPEDDGTVERAVRVARLMDLYGPLLTDRQRQFVQLHYEEDLSFGEIAREFEISRQAVHDAVKHAEQALEKYDAKLGLSPDQVAAAASRQSAEAPMAAPEAPKQPARVEGLGPCIATLEGAIDRLQRSGGVLYNVEGLKRELEEVATKLRSMDGQG